MYPNLSQLYFVHNILDVNFVINGQSLIYNQLASSNMEVIPKSFFLFQDLCLPVKKFLAMVYSDDVITR